MPEHPELDFDKLLEQTTVSRSVLQIAADYSHVHNVLTRLNAPTVVDGDMGNFDIVLSIVCDAYNKEIADRPKPRQHKCTSSNPHPQRPPDTGI